MLNAQQQLYATQRDLALARYTTLLSGLRLKAVSGILAETDLKRSTGCCASRAENPCKAVAFLRHSEK